MCGDSAHPPKQILMTNAMQKTLALVAFVCFMLSAKPFLAQTNPIQDGIIYVDCSALNPENYGNLMKQFKENAQLELGEACVPAHIISIRVKDRNLSEAQGFEVFKAKASGLGLGNLNLLADYTDESFMNRCKAARYGRN